MSTTTNIRLNLEESKQLYNLMAIYGYKKKAAFFKDMALKENNFLNKFDHIKEKLDKLEGDKNQIDMISKNVSNLIQAYNDLQKQVVLSESLTTHLFMEILRMVARGNDELTEVDIENFVNKTFNDAVYKSKEKLGL